MEQSKRMTEWENGFKTWREFFGKDSWLYSARMVTNQKSVPNDISAEELYQHFKARLMDEVVAQGGEGNDEEYHRLYLKEV
jgi:hypothetical protein